MAILKIRDKTGNIIDIPALQGPKGDSGKSIYEIACDNGFNGTEQEWLDGYTPNVIFVNNLYAGGHLAETIIDPTKIYLFIPDASLPGHIGSGLCLARVITVYDNETSETIIKTIKVTNTETLDVYDYDIAADAFTCVNQAGIKNYSDHVRWYIDGVAGDDKWGDGTADRPWKTIDHFFKQANKVTTDIRCYIVSAGRYDIVNPVINGVTIHITATVPGVELYSTKEDESLVFYNCHLNFQGVSSTEPLIINSAYGHWYSENCTNNFKFIRSEARYSQYGGTIDINDCTLYKVSLQGVNGQISKCTYTITDPTESCLDITEGSVMRLLGTTTFADRSEPGTGNSCFIYAIGSVVSILHGVSTLTNQPAYGLRMDNCFLTITTQRLNYYQNRSIHGNYFGLSNLIVTESTNLAEALNNKFNYKDCSSLAASEAEFESLLQTSEYYNYNGIYAYGTAIYINRSLIDSSGIYQYKFKSGSIYSRYYYYNGSWNWTSFTKPGQTSATTLAISDTNNIYKSTSVNSALQEVKLQADTTKSEVDNIGYEIGEFGGSDSKAWYDAGNYYINGTYQLIGDYCTITATVDKVPGWINIYYSLPLTPINLTPTDRSGSVVINMDNDAYENDGNSSGDSVPYVISTATNSYWSDTEQKVISLPAIAIRRLDNNAMTEGQITFTITYKYK